MIVSLRLLLTLLVELIEDADRASVGGIVLMTIVTRISRGQLTRKICLRENFHGPILTIDLAQPCEANIEKLLRLTSPDKLFLSSIITDVQSRAYGDP